MNTEALPSGMIFQNAHNGAPGGVGSGIIFRLLGRRKIMKISFYEFWEFWAYIYIYCAVYESD